MKPPPPVDGPTLPDAAAERALAHDDAPTVRDALPAAPPDEPAAAPQSWRDRFGRPPRGPLLLGLAASLLMVIGGFGAGGVLIHDPLLSNSPLGFWRYGHGRDLAAFTVYLGVGLMVWAWVRLGRDVLAHRVGGRGVLTVSGVWMAPMLVSTPLFTRDVYSYLAQGGLPLAGFDPYAVGPEVMPGLFSDNVHYFWQDTPAPYGPLFILIAKAVAWLAGDGMILGVVLMRLVMLPGLLLLVWALPELTRRLGGRVPVALWVAVANPLMVVHMVGGGHNDLLVVGLLAAGALVALRGGHIAGIALVTAAMATKASAGIALPFLVLVWAAHMSGSQRARIVKATAAGVGVFLVVFTACTVAAGVGLGWLPALSAPSMIVNWMSIPTAVGEFTHTLVAGIVNVPKQPFINVARALGGLLLVYIAATQWWSARDGGPDAVRRAGVVLLAVAVLSPATLPWYVSWGMALLAATAWSLRGLTVTVFLSVMLTIAYYSHGEDALYDAPYLLTWALVAVVAAVSLRRPDPLRLAGAARRRPRQAADAVPAGAGSGAR
ncbi:polyprenol phosphomannose-dependent alpha 1,6 mannosyltransferase MptB [Pseudonocardia sp. MH-G8]|uniref:polyprenol phosphomannose-dependent alpha 1,6 mannosyltransferase MptB n=1 Tax=Pseudonocardia sp. MH-G8 TaxID=1854588 RepID=UPI0018E95FAF|nr:polyprenol phosphomannose-dependent alpha 1,6 mannosyltransferase MptB [Pseudonocardia sp. MH-G8]